MEILAFTYLAADYEAPTLNRRPDRVGHLFLPSSAWITVAALMLVLSNLVLASSAAALIRRGDVGEEVAAVQTSLQNLGYAVGSIDGIFGSGTKGAVIRFQQQHGLTVDGIVGSQTLAKLAELESNATNSTTPTQRNSPAESPSAGTGGGNAVLTLGDSGTAIANLQTRLKDLGFFPAEVNVSGYYGPITAEAVKAFQRSQSLAVDGIAGPATQTALAATQPRVTVMPTPTPATQTPSPSPSVTSTPTPTATTPTVPPATGLLQQGDSGEAVTALQSSLQQLNYFSLPPTGYYGPVTTASVRTFQQAYGLTVDGIAGSRTLAKLAEISAAGSAARSAEVSTPTNEDRAVETSESNDTAASIRVTEKPPSLTESATRDSVAVQSVPAPVGESETAPTSGSVVTVRAASGLRIRTAPGTQAAIAGLLRDGTSVQITGEQVGDWLEINPSGWIHQDYVIR